MESKPTKDRKKLLTKVVLKMNSLNKFPLPVTKHLIECFNVVMTDEEAVFLERIKTTSYSYNELLGVSALVGDGFDKFLDIMLKKGFLFCVENKAGEALYRMNAIMVGWFEVFLSDGRETTTKKAFAKAFENYSNSRKFLSYFPARNIFNLWIRRKAKPFTEIAETSAGKQKRTLKLNKKISDGKVAVYPSSSVNELIEKFGNSNELAVVHCFCRQWKKMVGQSCMFGHEGESCIVLGRAVQAVLRAGVGRKISKKECLEIIGKTAEKGAVHQVFHDPLDKGKSEMAICNCCWDCCAMLGAFNRGLMHVCVKSNYIAEVDESSKNLCINCGRCEQYCPTNAIGIDDGKINLDAAKCIGCGQCRLQCPQKIFKLNSEERDVFIPVLKKSKTRIK